MNAGDDSGDGDDDNNADMVVLLTAAVPSAAPAVVAAALPDAALPLLRIDTDRMEDVAPEKEDTLAPKEIDKARKARFA